MTDPGYDARDARELTRLLAKFAAAELDQFDHWIVESSYGPVFVDIATQLPQDGRSAATYRTIWPLSAEPSDLAASDSEWAVYRRGAHGREEVDRFAARSDAEERVVELEQVTTPGMHWIGRARRQP